MSSLYIVIDLIHDLLAHEPMKEQIARRHILENGALVLAKARAAGVPVAYVRVAFTGDFAEAPTASPLFSSFKGSGLLRLGSSGVAVHPAIAPLPADIDIVKHGVSPFIGTRLDAEIARLGVTQLYISGISTTLAVSSAVREGHDRGLAITLIEDTCAAHDDTDHASEIRILSQLCTIRSASETTFVSL
ncbi:cysteine hydrolase family protein [Sphingobium rhizovicinum]|uniref:Cysteine hydrolase family protein n=1 Tax=Sphingobium rhizovicinum TaxID=432308 RepID=A0ABV7NNJ4_9SPHN